MTTKYPMNIVVRTPVQAYTPGQIINVEINASNQCNKSIVKFTVGLIRVRNINQNMIFGNLKKYFNCFSF